MDTSFWSLDTLVEFYNLALTPDFCDINIKKDVRTVRFFQKYPPMRLDDLETVENIYQDYVNLHELIDLYLSSNLVSTEMLSWVESLRNNLRIKLQFRIDRKFNAELEYQTALSNGNIPEGLRQEFDNNGISLSKNATVAFEETDGTCLIVDKNSKSVYPVYREEGKLTISDSKVYTVSNAQEVPRMISFGEYKFNEVMTPADGNQWGKCQYCLYSDILHWLKGDIEIKCCELEECNNIFTITPGGHKQKYCSKAHKMKVYRKRRKQPAAVS